jgi:hypothetical protein
MALQEWRKTPIAGGRRPFLFCTASTGIHRFPQAFREITLACVSCRFYYAHRLIGKKNFTSQFKDGGKGNTEPVNFELNEKCKLRSSVQKRRRG